MSKYYTGHLSIKDEQTRRSFIRVLELIEKTQEHGGDTSALEAELEKLKNRMDNIKSDNEAPVVQETPHIPIELRLPIPGSGNMPIPDYDPDREAPYYYIPAIHSLDPTKSIKWHLGFPGVSLDVGNSSADKDVIPDVGTWWFPALSLKVQKNVAVTVGNAGSGAHFVSGVDGAGRTRSGMYFLMNALSNYTIANNVFVDIIIGTPSAPNLTEYSPWVFNHSCGDRIRIFGQKYYNTIMMGSWPPSIGASEAITDNSLNKVTWPGNCNGVFCENGATIGCINGLWLDGGGVSGNVHGYMGIMAYYNSTVKIGNDWPLVYDPKALTTQYLNKPFLQGRMVITRFDNAFCASKGGVILASGNRDSRDFFHGWGIKAYSCQRGLWAAHNGQIIFQNGLAGLNSMQDLVAQEGGRIYASFAGKVTTSSGGFSQTAEPSSNITKNTVAGDGSYISWTPYTP